MLDYVVKLTREPWKVAEGDVDGLREAGFEDAVIRDICQVASYFNYVNPMADGLGVEMEAHWREEDYTLSKIEFEERRRSI